MSTCLLFLAPVLVTLALKVDSLVGIERAPSSLADSDGISRHRVNEVLDIAGLSDVAGQRVSTFSLGMNQRLGIAAPQPRRLQAEDPGPEIHAPSRLMARAWAMSFQRCGLGWRSGTLWWCPLPIL
jgi:hypothetical protein